MLKKITGVPVADFHFYLIFLMKQR